MNNNGMNNNGMNNNGMSNNVINNIQKPHKQGNRKKLVALIVSIGILVIIAFLGYFFLNNNKNIQSGNGSGHNKPLLKREDSLKDFEISWGCAYYMNYDNEVYGFGDVGSAYQDNNHSHDKFTFIADNVKKYDYSSNSYLDNDGNFYITDVNIISNGALDDYLKVASDIDDFAGSGLAYLLKGKDKKLYAVGAEGYDLSTNDVRELRQISGYSDVKKIYYGVFTYYYLDKNDNLYYADRSSSDFKLLLPNVKEVYDYYVITKDNKYYYLDHLFENQVVEAKLLPNTTRVMSMGWNFQDIPLNGDKATDLDIINYENGNNTISFMEKIIPDVSKILYINYNKSTIVYLSKNNKIVILSGFGSDINNQPTKKLEFPYTIKGAEKTMEYLTKNCQFLE